MVGGLTTSSRHGTPSISISMIRKMCIAALKWALICSTDDRRYSAARS